MKPFLAIMVAALAMAAPFAANATTTAQVMVDWSPAEMRAILSDMGMTVTGERANDEGSPILEAKSANGFAFEVYATECHGSTGSYRCDGAELVGRIDYDTEAQADRDFAKIDFAAVKYYKDDEDTIALSRYLIFDDGITRKNLEVNLRVFISICERVWKM